MVFITDQKSRVFLERDYVRGRGVCWLADLNGLEGFMVKTYVWVCVHCDLAIMDQIYRYDIQKSTWYVVSISSIYIYIYILYVWFSTCCCLIEIPVTIPHIYLHMHWYHPSDHMSCVLELSLFEGNPTPSNGSVEPTTLQLPGSLWLVIIPKWV